MNKPSINSKETKLSEVKSGTLEKQNEPEDHFILTPGVTYELPIGWLESVGTNLQGHGNGMVNLFISSAKGWGKLGLEMNVGTDLALDRDANTK